MINRIMNVIGDVVIGPWESVTVALVFSAGVFAAVIVGLLRLVGRPQNIRRARNRLLARTLELLLFGHDTRTLLSAAGRILVANGAYLRQFLIPLLVTALPVTLLLIQGAAWFNHRPFCVGEPIIVTVQLASDRPVRETSVGLKTADGLTLTAGPVRIASQNELCYRLAATQNGDGWVEFTVADHTIRKQIVVGDRLARLATERGQRWSSLLEPAEPALSEESPVVCITTEYPQRTWSWRFRNYDAGTVGLILTLVLSLLFARLFGVSVV